MSSSAALSFNRLQIRRTICRSKNGVSDPVYTYAHKTFVLAIADLLRVRVTLRDREIIFPWSPRRSPVSNFLVKARCFSSLSLSLGARAK